VTHEVNNTAAARPADPRLFLRDEELDRSVDLLLAAGRRLAETAETTRRAQNLSEPAFALLFLLRAEPGLSVTEARDRLCATTPTFARLIADLDSRGLIAKSRGGRDGRERRLSLSEDGVSVLAPISEALRDAVRGAWRETGADRVTGAVAALEALIK